MKAEATRSTILDAAIELGSLQGLEELSLGGLASAVNMSKSGLFAHFGSKHELQLATVAQAWETFEAEVVLDPPHMVLDPPLSLRGGLIVLLERWLSFHERKVFPGGCFFVVSAVEFASRADAVAKALASAVDRQTTALEAAVRTANKSGELRTYKEPRQTAFALFSTLTTADALFQIREDPVVFDQARETLRELLGMPDALDSQRPLDPA